MPGLTIDGLMSGMGRLPAGSTTELQVTGRAGVPLDGVVAVLNVTATAAQGGGDVTAYPCGVPRPNASNLNFEVGDTIANAVFATIGEAGKVCLYVSATTDLIVDLDGFVPSGSTFGPLLPARLLDSRGPGLTVDGMFSGRGRLVAGTVTRLAVAGRGAIPRPSGAAVLNVTVVGAESPGYLTVYPCSQTPPNASNLNFSAEQAIPNAVLAKLDVTGSICVYTSATVDLIVDVNGFLPTS